MKVKRSDRERAKYAFECVKAVNDNEWRKGYTSYIKKFPTMILQNGLGNTIAFYFSKGCEVKKVKENGEIKEKKIIKDAHGIILLQFFMWYSKLNSDEEIGKIVSRTIPDERFNEESAYEFIKSKIDNLLTLSTSAYRKMEKEALSLSNWLRRFAEGMIEGE